jgi:hypothetical protein
MRDSPVYSKSDMTGSPSLKVIHHNMSLSVLYINRFCRPRSFGEFQSKIQVGVCIALRDRLQLIGTYIEISGFHWLIAWDFYF